MILTILSWCLLVVTGIYTFWGLSFFFGLFRRFHRFSSYKPFVSVIIAARNEEKHLRETLACFVEQTYPIELYEVILVDDQSEDCTARIAQQFQHNYSNIKTVTIKEIPADFSPKKFALQEGIKLSKGEIILTTDADCRVPKTWIEAMVSHFTPEIGMVAGASMLRIEQGRRSITAGIQAIDFLALVSASAGSMRIGIPLAASGQNLSYRRSAYEEVGGFTKIIHYISGDDVLLLQLIKKYTRWKINFAEPGETTITTLPLSTFSDFLKQRMRWASNSSKQRFLDPLFFIYLVSIFCLCSGLLMLIPISIIVAPTSIIPLACLAAKFGIDLMVIIRGISFFHIPCNYLWYFLPWFLIHPLLLIISGIGGLTPKMTWKGRTFNQSK